MTTQHDELETLAAHEPVASGRADLPAIRRSGRRLRTRRRVTTGVASLAVVGAIAVPVGLAAHGPSESTSPGPATSGRGPTGDPTNDGVRHVLPEGCGVLGCPRDATPEPGKVLGEPWLVGELADGTDEVIYAARQAPGGRFLATGFRDQDGLAQAELLLRPGRQPGPGPLYVSGGARRQGPDGATYTIVGMVEGRHTNVAWRSEPGSFHRIDVNHDLAPGYTVFWFVDEWNESWPSNAGPPVTIRVDGRELTPSTV